MGCGYDIIGDIHGHADSLRALLGELGYRLVDGVMRHPSRTAIFLGDFIDRGPTQRETIALVRPMIDRGGALAVMGNHEFNAISYDTLNPATDEPLRRHSTRNTQQHQAFLDSYSGAERSEVLAWFRTLPLWLELDGLRVVHACWDKGVIARIARFQGGSALLGDPLLHASARRDTWQYEAIETVLKGKEVELKDGLGFHDKDGHLRHNIRVRWWDAGVSTYQEAFMGPESARTHIPDDDIGGDHLVEYGHAERPVFLGHYWLEGEPAPLAVNVACVDYSVAKPGGNLVAYRWDGEAVLTAEKFVAVARVEG